MRRISVLSALLALVLLLPACTGDAADVPTDDATDYDDALVGALYDESGEYTDEHGNTLRYDYAVPRVLSETAVAAALNQEIAECYGTIVEEQKSMMAAGASLTCLSISWESHWSDSLLCLVIRSVTDGGTADYSVYRYDFFGGKRLTGEDLAARCGLSTADFLASARRTLAREFDARWRDALLDGGAGFAARYAERRAWTLSDENINMQLPVYLDEGSLYLAALVGMFDGADSEQVLLPLDTAQPDTAERTAEDEFVHAALADGVLRVWFEERENAAWYAENFRFDYDTVYFAEGLYSEYADVCVGSMGQGYFPYIFLLTKEGTVEYVNLLEGLTAGFLCCGGPLGGVRNIVSFEKGEVETEFGGYETVFAVDDAGKKYDLSGAVSDADWVLPEEFFGTWSAEVTHDTAEEQYVSDYVLTISDGGGLSVVELVSGAGIYNEYSGQINYLGTNGEGMVYSYHLNGHAGAVRYGAFTLLAGEAGMLRVKTVAGEELFDAPVGRATEFDWSF